MLRLCSTNALVACTRCFVLLEINASDGHGNNVFHTKAYLGWQFNKAVTPNGKSHSKRVGRMFPPPVCSLEESTLAPPASVVNFCCSMRSRSCSLLSAPPHPSCPPRLHISPLRKRTPSHVDNNSLGPSESDFLVSDLLGFALLSLALLRLAHQEALLWLRLGPGSIGWDCPWSSCPDSQLSQLQIDSLFS